MKTVTREEIEAAAATLKKGLERLSNLVGPSRKVPDEVVAPMYDLTKKVGDILKTVQDPLKETYRAMVEKTGRTFTDAGSMMKDLAGWRLEIRPTGGGWDEDKLASLMRSKGLKRLKYTDKEVTFKPNDEKIQRLIGAEVVTEEEVNACKKPGGFSVQPPVQIEEEDDE